MAGHTREMEKTQTTLESTLESVDEAEAIVLRSAEKLGFDEESRQQIGMAVREIMVNAVAHGNRYNRNKKVHLDIEGLKDGLAIVIRDEGEGFDPSSIPDPLAPENLLKQSGRGMLLVRAFVDDVNFESRSGEGTKVRLFKNLPG